jgi:hypothetical protein
VERKRQPDIIPDHFAELSETKLFLARIDSSAVEVESNFSVAIKCGGFKTERSPDSKTFVEIRRAFQKRFRMHTVCGAECWPNIVPN